VLLILLLLQTRHLSLLLIPSLVLGVLLLYYVLHLPFLRVEILLELVVDLVIQNPFLTVGVDFLAEFSVFLHLEVKFLEGLV